MGRMQREHASLVDAAHAAKLESQRQASEMAQLQTRITMLTHDLETKQSEAHQLQRTVHQLQQQVEHDKTRISQMDVILDRSNSAHLEEVWLSGRLRLHCAACLMM